MLLYLLSMMLSPFAFSDKFSWFDW